MITLQLPRDVAICRATRQPRLFLVAIRMHHGQFSADWDPSIRNACPFNKEDILAAVEILAKATMDPAELLERVEILP